MNYNDRINELDSNINMLLDQIYNEDYPYTESEIRAIMHQVDRLAIRRDLLRERVNVLEQSKNASEVPKKRYKWYILYVVYLIALLLRLLSK
jgi:hypothetical protein